jgi:stage V sporulation protein G
MYADIAHPINVECREMIQTAVIEEFHSEKERAKLPGYVSRYDDHDYDYEFGESEPRQESGTPPFPKGASLQREAEPLRPPHVRPESETGDASRPASAGEDRDEG